MPFVPSFHSKLPAAEVFRHLKDQNHSDVCRGSRHLRLLGQLLCRRGYQQMMGIGKRRFHILNTAARKRETFAPFDLRFSPNRGRTIISEKRQQVFDFLHELWENVAEPIPDGLNSNKRPRHGNDKCDPKNMCRENIKHLPAGSINDYHRQCQAALKDMSVSRKLFCLVSWLNIRQKIGYI